MKREKKKKKKRKKIKNWRSRINHTGFFLKVYGNEISVNTTRFGTGHTCGLGYELEGDGQFEKSLLSGKPLFR